MLSEFQYIHFLALYYLYYLNYQYSILLLAYNSVSGMVKGGGGDQTKTYVKIWVKGSVNRRRGEEESDPYLHILQSLLSESC